jgi:hypothetical protein
MKLGVYTWFPYQSSKLCTEVNNITLLNSWNISAQGIFTKKADLFAEKIGNSLNGCLMKTFVSDGNCEFSTKYVQDKDSNGNIVRHIEGLEYDLLSVVLQQMHMTFVYVLTPEGFELQEGSVNYVIKAMSAKETYIALGTVGTHYVMISFFDSTNTYYMMRVRWYVPCSD